MPAGARKDPFAGPRIRRTRVDLPQRLHLRPWSGSPARPRPCRAARRIERQARGSLDQPSFTPSSRSHAASTAFWMAGSFAGGMALPGVISSACSFHTNAVNRCDQLFAGAPARMPVEVFRDSAAPPSVPRGRRRSSRRSSCARDRGRRTRGRSLSTARWFHGRRDSRSRSAFSGWPMAHPPQRRLRVRRRSRPRRSRGAAARRGRRC